MKSTCFSFALLAALAALSAFPAHAADAPSKQNYLTDDDIVSAVEAGLAASAEQISYGTTANGRLLNLGNDWYRFSGQAGDEIEIVMRSETFDTILELHSSTFDGPLVASDDDGLGEGTNSRIGVTLPQSGAYFLRADSYFSDTTPAGTGPYTLSLNRVNAGSNSAGTSALGSALLDAFGEDDGDDPPTNLALATQTQLAGRRTPIAYGQTLNGALEGGPLTGGDLMEGEFYYDAFTFQGRAGDRITATMRSGAFDTYLTLFGPSSDTDYGEGLVNNDDGAGGSDSRVEYTLPADGDYILQARSFQPGITGSYTLELAGVQSAPSANSGTSFLDEVNAQLNRPGFPPPNNETQIIQGELGPGDAVFEGFALYDIIPFEGRAGERVSLRMRSSAFDPMLRLLGPGSDANHGEQIAFNDDDAASGLDDARIEITLPADGTYFVHATVYGGGTGAYTFELTRP